MTSTVPRCFTNKSLFLIKENKQTNKEHTQNTTTKAKEKKRRKISKIKPLFTPHQPANGDCDFYMLSKGMFMNASKFYNYSAVCLSASLSFRQSVCSCISLPVLSQSGDGGILSYEPPSIKTLVIDYHKKSQTAADILSLALNITILSLNLS